MWIPDELELITLPGSSVTVRRHLPAIPAEKRRPPSGMSGQPSRDEQLLGRRDDIVVQPTFQSPPRRSLFAGAGLPAPTYSSEQANIKICFSEHQRTSQERESIRGLGSSVYT
ncbi:hypothetical protein Bbelb_264110 [Branchiostoma belcheri]|nr:hypothetical protein Bbelb_264110 [Branchiostoma belcheri]